MKVSEAIEVTGGLSNPSKLPGASYGIPAHACRAGSAIAQINGSICSTCYALAGRYLTTAVIDAQARRIASLGHPDWLKAMVRLIRSRAEYHARQWAKASRAQRKAMRKRYAFRWHDAGDIQSLDHLLAIAQIARELPMVDFWLPTREVKMVRNFLAQFGAFPANLRVRLSATMVDGAIPPSLPGIGTSGAHSAREHAHGFVCRAPSQDGHCRTCRACWSHDVDHVSYELH